MLLPVSPSNEQELLLPAMNAGLADPEQRLIEKRVLRGAPGGFEKKFGAALAEQPGGAVDQISILALDANI